jgi:hypothetical protein
VRDSNPDPQTLTSKNVWKKKKFFLNVFIYFQFIRFYGKKV